ncbi:protease HtpX [Sansalvadorimonas sp. 2012CJ34-2]|uniref:Protease HtpX n=1 Tax=Parendozoicomonas callyspongiae TaxID=2942213 RepID=A0ABT0PI35_9GAMM|nr:protease HtpX [Sansalvadorimonas sp. 2012CJ34-2]MCL6271032.1 protease HtpX [Sansalvadorimonas sp. 2012CJ34-2]
MKRILLFVATNLAVVLVLGIVTSIVLPMLGLNTQGMSGLFVFALIFGFGGAFISLAISKWMALRSTGAQVIEQPRNATEHWLMETVSRQAQSAGIAMPQVAVYDAPDVNAFATGPSRNNALVAVSTGLLRNMSQDEAEAVLGHEISHVANGDMVTLTLIQGVVNTFVIFIARAIAMMINNFLRNDEEGGGLGMFAYMGVVFVLEAILGIGASIIVMWFSRQREFRADEGGANLAGRHKMIAALRRLQGSQEPQMEGSLAAFCISGKRGISELFLSHPPLEKRIAHLQSL